MLWCCHIFTGLEHAIDIVCLGVGSFKPLLEEVFSEFPSYFAVPHDARLNFDLCHRSNGACLIPMQGQSFWPLQLRTAQADPAQQSIYPAFPNS